MSHAFNSLADCFWNSCRKDAKSKPPTPWRRDGSSLSLSPSMHLAPSQVSVTSMVPQTRDSRNRNGCFASRWRKLPSSASHQRKKARKKKESYIGFCKPDIQYWRMRRCRTTKQSMDNKEARKHTWRETLSSLNPTESHQNKIVETVGQGRSQRSGRGEIPRAYNNTALSHGHTTHVKRRRGKETKTKSEIQNEKKREKEQTLPRVAKRTLALRDFFSKEKQDRIPVPKLEKRTKNWWAFPRTSSPPPSPHTHTKTKPTLWSSFFATVRERWQILVRNRLHEQPNLMTSHTHHSFHTSELPSSLNSVWETTDSESELRSRTCSLMSSPTLNTHSTR